MTEENISAIRARLKFKNLDDFSKGYARYISSGGIFIPMAPERLKPVGALIRFQFLLGDGSTALLGEGRVHQVRAQSSSGKAPIGMLVKFTKLSQTSKKLVEQIVLAKKAATSSEDSSASSEPSEPDPPAPKESEPVQEEEQSLPEQEPAPTTEKPQGEPGIFGLASGHSSLEEETRAGPSPNDITPTKHLAPHNQPSDEPPKADDAPTRDGEQPASAPSEQSAIAPPTNPFEARTVSNSSDDPPTREVEPEDAHRTPTQEQDDPYAIDLFGDIDLGLGTPEDKASAHSSHDLSLFDEPSSPPEEDSSPAPEEEEVDEPSDLDEVEQESSEEDTPEDDEQVFSQEPSDDTPAKDDALEETPSVDESDTPASEDNEQEQEESEDESVSDVTVDEPSEEEAPVLTSDESVEPDKDTPLETLPSEEGAEEAEQSSEEPADIETDEEEVEAAADEHIEDVTSNEQSSEAIIEEEPAQIEEPQDIPPEENAPAEADQAVSASPARSLSSIKLPPPPTLKSPPPLGNLPGADDVDLDLIFSDDDDLLGDIMRPGLTATAQPLEIPEKPAVEVQEEALKALEDDTSSEPEQEQPEPGSSVDDIDVLMDDLPLSPEEESEALDLFDIVAPAREDAPPVDYKDDIDAGRAPDSFSSGALTKPTPPRQLAQTEGGLQVLAYDDSSAFDTSLEALSVADDAEDIDLMFDGIFGGGGESEDDIFGDMFTTQSLEAVSSPQNPILDDEIATPVDVEDEEPSKELSSLLDNLESDEEEELDIGGLDLQGPSFAEEDQPSAEEEEESLAALLESARQDIDKIQQHKQEEEVQDGDAGDALLANLLGDDALEAPPEEEVAGALPVPEPKKKEKRGLFSKLFGKDD